MGCCLMAFLITDAEKVSGEWLQAILRTHGDLAWGTITTFTKTVSRPFGAATVHIEVGYSQTVTAALPPHFLLKIDGPQSLAGDLEVEFYTHYGLTLPNSPTVRCFDAVYDGSSRAYHVLLEDLTATHYTVEREAPPTQTEAEHMIDALAILHAGWWDKLDTSVALTDADLLTEPAVYFEPFAN